MTRLAIVHFSPIELYPPVLNWLNYLADSSTGDLQVRVFTMHAAPEHKIYQPQASFIKIFRRGFIKKQGSRVANYLNYLFFYASTTFKLAIWRPEKVLYYETLSAFPPLFYQQYINTKSELLVHYHEYISEAEYERGIPLNRWLHKKEKKRYPYFSWVSHTNADRMLFFSRENDRVDPSITHILPNYPPLNWRRPIEYAGIKKPVRIVYVGALNSKTMYAREFAQWVIQRNGEVTWDIYSANTAAETQAFLQSLDSPFIRFHGHVDYFTLPVILQKYDVGVILYKGHISNYVYNAPNKLFEYFAVCLDTWFPEKMQSSLPYQSDGTFPKITAINFENLAAYDFNALVDHTGLKEKRSPYYAEQVLTHLLEEIVPGDKSKIDKMPQH